MVIDVTRLKLPVHFESFCTGPPLLLITPDITALAYKTIGNRSSLGIGRLCTWDLGLDRRPGVLDLCFIVEREAASY